MRHKGRLVAAVTASGAILCLTLSASGRSVDGQSNPNLSREKPLSLRVEDLREKLRAGFPALGREPGQQKIDNVVQFFNFLNCHRPGWKNC
jgi:hypothetical protein